MHSVRSVESFLKSHLVSSFPIPVVGSTFKFGWISNAGVMLFIGSIVGGLIQGLSVSRLAAVMAKTIFNLRFTTITIISLIALASVMNHSGMIAALAAGLVAISGSFYPFFAPSSEQSEHSSLVATPPRISFSANSRLT